MESPVTPAPANPPPQPRSRRSLWFRRVAWGVLTVSLLGNAITWWVVSEYLATETTVRETFKSGSHWAKDKIAVISVSGTISPPFTSRIIRNIEHARDDSAVKGVLLTIDSPGGFVADSHQIYHKLKELSAKKPVFAAMKSFCASGGLYITMGIGEDGRIYAEPTTWTGSIGVIIPRYEVAKLATEWGVQFAPLKTGPMKDSLSPFRELAPAEVAVWDDILNQSFERFLKVIDENRKPLDYAGVKSLATGRIYTADDAVKNGLVDQIGYEDEAIESLKQKLSLKSAKVVKYSQPETLLSVLLGRMESRAPASPWQTLLESAVPREMYFCSGLVPPPAASSGE